MGRAPCCEKMGLKKGPWTPEEDQVLVSYIQRYGHGNWRALPKQAGLLRCGKSCRLRWMNYLRPDIKRGHFTREEEETIISLHQLLGNRWSAIAARLPGRTDNEIKNVWHTHLKKRVRTEPYTQEPKKRAGCDATAGTESKPITLLLDEAPSAAAYAGYEHPGRPVPTSPPQSCSELSSTATDTSTSEARESNSASVSEEYTADVSSFLDMDEEFFWSEVLSSDNPVTSLDLPEHGPLPFNHVGGGFHTDATYGGDDADFWLRVLVEAGGSPELLTSSDHCVPVYH